MEPLYRTYLRPRDKCQHCGRGTVELALCSDHESIRVLRSGRWSVCLPCLQELMADSDPAAKAAMKRAIADLNSDVALRRGGAGEAE